MAPSSFQKAPLSQLSTWPGGVPRPSSQKLPPGARNVPHPQNLGAVCSLWARRSIRFTVRTIAAQADTRRASGRGRRGSCTLPTEAFGQGLLWQPRWAHRPPFRFYAHISLPSPPASVGLSLKYTSLILSFLLFKACPSSQILPQMPAGYSGALPFKRPPRKLWLKVYFSLQGRTSARTFIQQIFDYLSTCRAVAIQSGRRPAQFFGE